LTREDIIELFPRDGEIRPDPGADLLKAAMLTMNGTSFTGIIRGLGMKKGALAASCPWEAAGIVVFGADEQDMASAVNRVAAKGGGIVLCSDGKIRAELPLPYGGFASDLKIEEVAERMEHIKQQAKHLGFRFEDAPLTLSTLTTPAIPFLRMSEDGLVDFKTGRIHDVFVD
jgi:adenine deaminase